MALSYQDQQRWGVLARKLKKVNETNRKIYEAQREKIVGAPGTTGFSPFSFFPQPTNPITIPADFGPAIKPQPIAPVIPATPLNKLLPAVPSGLPQTLQLSPFAPEELLNLGNTPERPAQPNFESEVVKTPIKLKPHLDNIGDGDKYKFGPFDVVVSEIAKKKFSFTFILGEDSMSLEPSGEVVDFLFTPSDATHGKFDRHRDTYFRFMNAIYRMLADHGMYRLDKKDTVFKAVSALMGTKGVTFYGDRLIGALKKDEAVSSTGSGYRLYKDKNELIKRARVLIGAMQAGNNSKELVQELLEIRRILDVKEPVAPLLH